MTGIPYTGNPANFSSSIQLLLDDDKQRAGAYNPALQQLEDNVAYLQSRANAATATGGLWLPIPIGSAVLLDREGAATGTDEWYWTMAVLNSLSPEPALQTMAGASTTAYHSFVLSLSPYLPAAGFLRGVRFDVFGVGAYTDVPEKLPSAHLYAIDVDSPWARYPIETEPTGPTGPCVAYDNVIDVASYKARHTVKNDYLASYYNGATAIDLSLQKYRSLFLLINSEYGVQALNGTVYCNPMVWVAPTNT
jgi:hypothetical protein